MVSWVFCSLSSLSSRQDRFRQLRSSPNSTLIHGYGDFGILQQTLSLVYPVICTSRAWTEGILHMISLLLFTLCCSFLGSPLSALSNATPQPIAEAWELTLGGGPGFSVSMVLTFLQHNSTLVTEVSSLPAWSHDVSENRKDSEKKYKILQSGKCWSQVKRLLVKTDLRTRILCKITSCST